MWPNPQFPADLVTFTIEIVNGKLYFLWSVFTKIRDNLVGIYMSKVNGGNTKAMCQIWRHWYYFGVFVVKFEHISHIVLAFPLLTWTSKCWLVQNFRHFADTINDKLDVYKVFHKDTRKSGDITLLSLC